MALLAFRRAGTLACAVAAILAFAGCGDVFRPVANPTLQPGGDPQRQQHIVVLETNGGSSPGSVTAIDVSGDTIVGTVPVGRGPVYAALVGSVTVVANSADDTVSAYTTLLPQNLPSTITLQAGAHPVFVGSAESGTAYVVEPGLSPPSVAAVSLATTSVTADIPVGNNPVMVTETPDRKKVYAVNQGSNTLTRIFTVDRSTGSPVAVGTSPVYAVPSSDSALVYVVNQGSNSVSVINTTTDARSMADIPVGAGPNYAFFDRTLKHVYVTNGAGNSLSIIDASTSTPTLIATVPESGACSGSGPVAVTAIADGSRVYVVNRDSNNVCVLNTTNNTFFRTIPVGNAPISIQASTDGSKVFVANSLSNTVSDIRTTDDTVVATLSMPQTGGCTNPAPPAPPSCGPISLSIAP